MVGVGLSTLEGVRFLGCTNPPHPPPASPPAASPAPCSLLVEAAYARTKALLATHATALRGVAELLLQRETINQSDLAQVAGPRPWAAHAQLKQYVDMLYEEEAEGGGKKENAEGAGSGEPAAAPTEPGPPAAAAAACDGKA